MSEATLVESFHQPRRWGITFPGPLRFTCSRLQAERVSQLGLCLQSPAMSKLPQGIFLPHEKAANPGAFSCSSGENWVSRCQIPETHVLLTGGWQTCAWGQCPAFPGKSTWAWLWLRHPPSLSPSPGICQIVGAEGVESMPSSIFFFNLTRTFPAWADCHMPGRVSSFHNLVFSPPVQASTGCLGRKGAPETRSWKTLFSGGEEAISWETRRPEI